MAGGRCRDGATFEQAVSVFAEEMAALDLEVVTGEDRAAASFAVACDSELALQFLLFRTCAIRMGCRTGREQL
jgi:hypothetical protein